MEFLIVLLILFGVVNSIIKKGKEYAQRNNTTSRPSSSPAEEWPDWPEVDFRPQPSPSSVKKETSQGFSRDFTRAENYNAPTPSVMDWKEREAEFDEPYVGSLGVASGEGKSQQDEGRAKRRSAEQFLVYGANVEDELISVDAKTMLQGVVMSEILMRPSQRKWGRR